MLTRVDVTSVNGTLVLPMAAHNPGYVIKNIDGLGPIKATITSTSMAQVDGSQKQSSRRDIRNITAKLGFSPDYRTNTVHTLRQALYSYLLPKTDITMGFYIDDVLTMLSSGTVEDLDDTARFSAEPEMDLSVICYDPDFVAPASVRTTGSTVNTTTTVAVPYTGSSPAGVIFTLNANHSLTGFTLYMTHQDNTQEKLDVTGVSIASGDVVTVNTIPGSKGITLNHSGTKTSLLYGVDPASQWLTLKTGANAFRCTAATTGVPYTLDYTAKYAGL
jgi:Phage tail protein